MVTAVDWSITAASRVVGRGLDGPIKEKLDIATAIAYIHQLQRALAAGLIYTTTTTTAAAAYATCAAIHRVFTYIYILDFFN